jgi:hypothetical protein
MRNLNVREIFVDPKVFIISRFMMLKPTECVYASLEFSTLMLNMMLGGWQVVLI